MVKNGRPAAPGALQAQFWEGIRSGLGVVEAGRAAGVGREIAFRWFRKAGGVKSNGPRPAGGRYLGVREREEIAAGLAAGEPVRAIAARLGRAPSTVSREIRRNSRGRRYYRALAAQGQAQWRAAWPKTAKLAGDAVLRAWVQEKLEQRWSPEQISVMLKREFPGDAEMRVSHETICQAIYVQGRGALRRELAACLADRAGAAQAAAPRRRAAREDPRHGDDQRASGGGPGPGGAGPLGRRPDHRRG